MTTQLFGLIEPFDKNKNTFVFEVKQILLYTKFSGACTVVHATK